MSLIDFVKNTVNKVLGKDQQRYVAVDKPKGKPYQYRGMVEPKAYVPDAGKKWNPLTKYPRNRLCFCGSNRKSKFCCLVNLSPVVDEKEYKKLQEFVKRARAA